MTMQLPARDSFATDIVPGRYFRFSCPHCAKVLKVRVGSAGEWQVRGRCPRCGIDVEFHRNGETEKSGMARTLQAHVCERDSGLREGHLQRLEMLLAQGTCRDYGLGTQMLAGCSLSAKQWRRILREAAVREVMRRRLEESVNGDLPEEPLALCEESENEARSAWEIMVRFIHHEREGDCEACRENPTGLSCMYLHFEAFIEKCRIAEKRSERWRRAVLEMIGV